MASPRQAMKMDPTPVSWSTLYKELLTNISERCTRTDRARFRAVCQSWRAASSIPRSLTTLLSSVRHYPFPKLAGTQNPNKNSYSTVVLEFRRYLIINPATGDWFVAQIGLPEERNNQVASFSTERCKCVHSLCCTCVDLLEHRVYELAMWYAVKFIGSKNETLLEMTVIPSVKSVEEVKEGGDRVRLMAVYQGRLVHMRLRDKMWKVVEVNHPGVKLFSDVCFREGTGKYYGVDDVGNLAIVDNRLKVGVVVWDLLLPDVFPDDKFERRFVMESEGKVYQVVDKMDCKSGEKFGRRYTSGNMEEDVKIKIYLLDEEEQGRKKWIRVRDLGNRAFVIGHCCCFALAAHAVPGLKSNCVYYHEAGVENDPGDVDVFLFYVDTGVYGRILSRGINISCSNSSDGSEEAFSF